MSELGIEYIESKLCIVKNVAWNQIWHNDAIINFICQNKLNINDFWLSREVKKNLKSLVVPDLIIINKDIKQVIYENEQIKVDTKTSFEFELTWKTKKRYKQIFDLYALDFEAGTFNRIVYFLKPSIKFKMVSLLNDMPNLEENILIK